MAEVLVFKFPSLDESHRTEVERKLCELICNYRNGALLHPEDIDWMDSANNWLLSAKSRV